MSKAYFSMKKIQIFYTVDNPADNWRGGTGYVSKDTAVKGLPAPSDDSLILVSPICCFCISSFTASTSSLIHGIKSNLL